jgi:hypothetical protein
VSISGAPTRALERVRDRQPRILGALLDAAVLGLRTLPGGRVADFTGGPRLADERCGLPAPLRVPYDARRKAAVEGIIEMDPVAVCVRILVVGSPTFCGGSVAPARDCANS